MITPTQVYTFLGSYLLFVAVFVYGLHVPQRMTGNPTIVHEYYYTNWKGSLPLDVLFIGLYGWVAYAIWTWLALTSPYHQFGVLLLTTGLLTLFFWQAFTRFPVGKSFFSRWFHEVGWRAALYDMVVMGVIFIVYTFLLQLSI